MVSSVQGFSSITILVSQFYSSCFPRACPVQTSRRSFQSLSAHFGRRSPFDYRPSAGTWAYTFLYGQLLLSHRYAHHYYIIGLVGVFFFHFYFILFFFRFPPVRIPDAAADEVQVHIVAGRRGRAPTVRQVRWAVHAQLQVPGRVAHVQVRAAARGHHRTRGRGGADQLAQVRAQVRTERVQTGTATAATATAAAAGVRAAGRGVQVHRGAVVQVRATGHGARVRPPPPAAAGRGRVLRLHGR